MAAVPLNSILYLKYEKADSSKISEEPQVGSQTDVFKSEEISEALQIGSHTEEFNKSQGNFQIQKIKIIHSKFLAN